MNDDENKNDDAGNHRIIIAIERKVNMSLR